MKTKAAWVAELVDARDLKSLGSCSCVGSIPTPGTRNEKRFALQSESLFLS